MEEFSNYELPGKYVEEIFFMNSKDKPRARQRTWRYRWRGRETGEREIQEGSDDEYLSTVTFSNKGIELSGTLKCSHVKSATSLASKLINFC